MRVVSSAIVFVLVVFALGIIASAGLYYWNSGNSMTGFAVDSNLNKKCSISSDCPECYYCDAETGKCSLPLNNDKYYISGGYVVKELASMDCSQFDDAKNNIKGVCHFDLKRDPLIPQYFFDELKCELIFNDNYENPNPTFFPLNIKYQGQLPVYYMCNKRDIVRAYAYQGWVNGENSVCQKGKVVSILGKTPKLSLINDNSESTVFWNDDTKTNSFNSIKDIPEEFSSIQGSPGPTGEAGTPGSSSCDTSSTFDQSKCSEDFEGYTGIKLEFIDVENSRQLELTKKYCEFVSKLTPEVKNSLKNIITKGGKSADEDKEFKTGASGYAQGFDTIILKESKAGEYWIFRHEIGHIFEGTIQTTVKTEMLDKWDEAATLPSEDIVIMKEDTAKTYGEWFFWKNYPHYNGPLYGFANPYGTQTVNEDIAVFFEKVGTNPDWFKDIINPKNKNSNDVFKEYNPAYKQKLDLLYQYKFISCCEYKAVLEAAGLQAPDCKTSSETPSNNDNPSTSSTSSDIFTPEEPILVSLPETEQSEIAETPSYPYTSSSQDSCCESACRDQEDGTIKAIITQSCGYTQPSKQPCKPIQFAPRIIRDGNNIEISMMQGREYTSTFNFQNPSNQYKLQFIVTASGDFFNANKNNKFEFTNSNQIGNPKLSSVIAEPGKQVTLLFKLKANTEGTIIFNVERGYLTKDDVIKESPVTVTIKVKIIPKMCEGERSKLMGYCRVGMKDCPACMRCQVTGMAIGVFGFDPNYLDENPMNIDKGVTISNPPKTGFCFLGWNGQACKTDSGGQGICNINKQTREIKCLSGNCRIGHPEDCPGIITGKICSDTVKYIRPNVQVIGKWGRIMTQQDIANAGESVYEGTIQFQCIIKDRNKGVGKCELKFDGGYFKTCGHNQCQNMKTGTNFDAGSKWINVVDANC